MTCYRGQGSSRRTFGASPHECSDRHPVHPAAKSRSSRQMPVHNRQYVRLTHGSQLAASAPRRPLGLLSTRGGSPVDAWGSPTRSTGSEDGSRPSAPNRRLTTSNAQQPDTSRHQPLIHPCPSIDVCRVRAVGLWVWRNRVPLRQFSVRSRSGRHAVADRSAFGPRDDEKQGESVGDATRSEPLV